MTEETEDSLSPSLYLTRQLSEGGYIYVLETAVQNRCINSRSENFVEFPEEIDPEHGRPENTVNVWLQYDLYPEGEAGHQKDAVTTIRCNPKGLPGFIIVSIYDDVSADKPTTDPPASGRSIIRFEKAKPLDEAR